MNKEKIQSLDINDLRQGEDKHFETQMQTVFKAFYSQPKTMLMVDIETGIMRSNITRYVGKWHKQNSISIIKYGTCPISKRGGVQFLTTNPELFQTIVEPLNTIML